MRDDEFARQAIAGVNPVSIERLKVFPPVSRLDPEIYGPQESALKEEHILGFLNGMTVQQVTSITLLLIAVLMLLSSYAYIHSQPSISFCNCKLSFLTTGIGEKQAVYGGSP